MNSTALRTTLLVVAAFVLLVGSWVAAIHLANSVPHRQLTPEEEARVLHVRSGQP